MSELREARWAVMSERGREASGLDYARAAGLVRELKGAGLSGLCIVTDAAASHLPPAPGGADRKPSRTDNPKPPPQPAGRKSKKR